jgi:hypothetical protein
MTSWIEPDYDRLFRDHPPTHSAAPRGDDLQRIARDLGRSAGAVSAQWDDARSSVLGSRSAASEGLVSYLQRRGWLR